MLAGHFRHWFESNPGRLHFAAHSHHPWPDATRAAHLRAWEDAATLTRHKWQRVFGEIVPRAQDHLARLLQLGDPRQVAFAPNVHEFIARLFSCLPQDRPVRVLCSAHEFHSFRRQAKRFEEAGWLQLEQVPAEPWDSFTRRFVAAERRGGWDMVFLSHVFYDTGFVVQDLDAIAEAAPPGSIVAFDGYHAFCALPIDLSRIHRRAFYMAGGYKYAMSGEGACFLAVPPHTQLRPLNTGWFASSETPDGPVHYPDDAFRFWGSTFDPSGLYRFNAAMDWLQSTGTTIAEVHRHARSLQKHFLDGLARLALPALPATALVPPAAVPRGNFLACDVDGAEAVQEKIAASGVTMDRRGRCLRFGFGVYHDEAQVDRLLATLGEALR